MDDLWLALEEHLTLVLLPTLVALILALPMAYVAVEFKSVSLVLGGASAILQTIPGLALLTFLIPLVGIGTAPAYIALTVYALLPLFVNTLQGFLSIKAIDKLTAQTLSMNRWQKLYWLEFPVSLPLILTGIQTALVTAVSNATLAALVGAGGFGKKIIAGLAVNNMTVVAAGAIPATLLAVALYFILELFIRWAHSRVQ